MEIEVNFIGFLDRFSTDESGPQVAKHFDPNSRCDDRIVEQLISNEPEEVAGHFRSEFAIRVSLSE